MIEHAQWILRERRARLALLRAVPARERIRLLCVCQACGELCLCIEVRCANGGGARPVMWSLPADKHIRERQIRCCARRDRLG